MKKFSLKKNPFVIVFIVVLFVFSVFATAVIAVETLKQSDFVPQGDDYGTYYDKSKSKVREKKILVNKETISVAYVRTENLKELPATKRADHYGTYDVYADENQTEYLFLSNTDIYCGYKMNNVGVTTLQKDAIEKDKALKIADAFLNELRTNGKEYILLSCVYDDLSGYYDIQYYLPVDGYKSDDIFRLWVNAEGKVTSFSEFNYNRYAKVEISENIYAKADQKLTGIVTKKANNLDFAVADQYISIDDSGKVVLVKVIDIRIPSGENYIVQRELYIQPIE